MTGNTKKINDLQGNTSGDRDISFSYFDSPNGVHAEVWRMPFKEVAEGLTEKNTVTQKKIDSISPFIYRDDYRNKSNAVTAEMLMLDIDNAPDTVTADQVIESVRPYTAATYSTFSHKHEGKGGRYRLLVLLDRPISAAGYKEAGLHLINQMGEMGQYVDSSSLNPSQQFYLPGVLTEDLDKFEFAYYEGKPFDWKGIYPVNFNVKKEKEIMTKNQTMSVGKIFEGSRNKTLSTEAYKLKNAGFSDAAVKTIIQERNENDCVPPLEDSEIQSICASAEKINPACPVDPFFTGPLTHVSLAEYVTNKSQGTLKYVVDSKHWMRMNEDGIWSSAPEAEIKKMIHDAVQNSYDEVEKTSLSSEAKNNFRSSLISAESSAFMNGTYSMLAMQDDVQVKSHHFDSNIHLVGLKGGKCYDLQNLEVREITDKDYVTKYLGTHFDASATAPLWERCMDDWTCNDEKLKEYLQNYCGYCLSGEAKLQWLNFLHGSGANGKSVFLNILLRMMNNYAKNVDSSTLMESKRTAGTATGDIFRLEGARVAISSELPANKSFDEALLKKITGGDVITARPMYGDEIEFRTQLKLFIVGNNTPVIRSTDNGIWRRMKLVPFKAKIECKDLDLENKLIAELPGILNWMLVGWENYKISGGIKIPECIENASKEYREEMDIMGAWIHECLEESPKHFEASSRLYECYNNWCEINNYSPLSIGNWSREYAQRGYIKKKHSDGYKFFGMKIISHH